MSACHGHYPACTHRDDSIACDACIEYRMAGPLFCRDLDNCGGPGCMDNISPAYLHGDVPNTSVCPICHHEGDMATAEGDVIVYACSFSDDPDWSVPVPVNGGSAPNQPSATGSNANSRTPDTAE